MELRKANVSRIAIWLLGTSMVSLAYLIVLDAIFVLFLNEQQTWLNTLPWGVFVLPIVWGVITYKGLVKYKYLGVVTGLFLGYVVAHLELLWVATSFHTMLGGSI
ncbi:hypothetical protein ACJJIW_20885 [Microbulbifer sp. JMSA004]|uniref:hypothetical protein n=1 Tax=Microbulbifer sp. JMSA004 TaxID=3243370 RepID=UPI00403A4D60